MKDLVNVTEIEGDGLVGLLGEQVTIFCSTYIYSGKLVGVNDTFVKLEGATLVFDTGSFTSKDWATAEKFPGTWYVQTSAVESFGLLK